jgi:acetyl esterase/lipase
MKRRKGVARSSALLAAGALAAAPFVERMETKSGDHSHPSAHLRVDDTIGDLLSHSAFSGFAHLLLPWDDRRYDRSMRIEEIASLLPYHTHVQPAVVVSSLNRLIDEVAARRQVFYDFYTVEEKEADPSRRSTGLFLMRGKPDAPFAVIAPGGGFTYVGSVHEGFPYAAEISERGINAFVLKYRAGQGERVATQDLAAALTYIFRNAKTFGVATEGYSVWGSSAGARMVASIGSHGAVRYGGDDLPRPSTVIMLYTGHSDRGVVEPPTFVAVGKRDGIAPPAVTEKRVAALRSLGTDVEYHQYSGVGHGFGLGVGTSAEGWLEDAVRFWARQRVRTASENRE